MAEAGLVLVDARGQLQALASSSERMHLVELLEVQHEDGPCLDCWRSGGAVAAEPRPAWHAVRLKRSISRSGCLVEPREWW